MAKIYNGGVYVSGDKYPNKIYVSGSKLGKATWAGEAHVWSDYIIEPVEKSLTFKPDETSGGLQGDYSYGCGTGDYPDMITPGDITLQIDPAGGTGYFSFKSRLSNEYEKISLLTYSYESSTGISKDGLFAFTKNDAGTTSILNTYEGGLGLTTYSRIGKIENTLNNYVSKLTFDKDCTVYFSIGPNNTSSASYGELKIIGFFDEFGGVTYMSDNTVRNPKGYNTLPELKGKTEMTVMKWWQKPNVLYYVNMAFVNLDAMNISNENEKIDDIILSSYCTTFEVTSKKLWLYVEFGVSIGGGTIYWNGTETNEFRSQGISSRVPDNIHEYIKFTYSLPTENQYMPGFWISVDDGITTNGNFSTFNKGNHGQFIQYNVVSLKNTEQYNSKSHIHQQYLVDNLYISPVDSGDGSDTNIRDGYVTHSYKKGSQSNVLFRIKRSATTDNWGVGIKATLDYESGKMHYQGSTSTSSDVPTFEPDTRTDLTTEILGY